jgi:hypothetical protein
MQIDSASDITIISKKNWELIGKPSLSKSDLETHDASLNVMDFLGEFSTTVKFQSKEKVGRILISPNHINLLGLDFMHSFKMLDVPLNEICNAISSKTIPQLIKNLKVEFKNVFTEKLGHCKEKVKLHLKPSAVPVFCPSRPVAYAFESKVEEELK